MALARALSRRTLSFASVAPLRCFISIQNDKDTIPPSTEGDNENPSTSSNRVMGWLRGPEANKPNKSVEEEWEELRDPQTGAVSWRSILTGETTVPGAPKPETWIEVVDKKTGLIYYWCRRTGDTTVLGEPKPGPYGRKLQFDAEDLHLEEGRGGEKEAEGPSLMRLVANPLIIGVSLVAVLGICYESFFK
ncbi:hypothetical protein Vretimale_12783 [Volvox reticuliferus]|uniref:WW domain-containing protein n=1 Tax=Volvox reticuliferus TaxID=1737510 RepID=A0A8J4GKI5_9CHLO|nr:hypothetical protein Vretifemale_10210 [Volvox reticuliferus]GIM08826.1 hypothetical protein Vretimale_12783 [Volvox reticuliferus]